MLHKSEKQTFYGSQPTCVLTRHFLLCCLESLIRNLFLTKSEINCNKDWILSDLKTTDCVYVTRPLLRVPNLGDEKWAKQGSSDFSFKKQSVIGNHLWDNDIKFINVTKYPRSKYTVYKLCTPCKLKEYSWQFVIFI